MDKNMNCVIVHGCPSDQSEEVTKEYAKHWIPWIANELNTRDIKTTTPLMPEPWHPVYERFKEVFEKYEVTENTVLVGHSCGCAFLVRWLGETKRKIKKLILVAPWKIPDAGDEYRQNFYVYPIDKTIKSRIEDIVMFTADNEEENGNKALRIFHDALEGRIIELRGRGHYTESSMGGTVFPELLEEILK